MPRPEDKSVKQKVEIYAGEKEKPTDVRNVTPTSASSCIREESREGEITKKLELHFISSSDDKILDSLSPKDLSSAIDRGRVKYIYRGNKIPEDKDTKIHKRR